MEIPAKYDPVEKEDKWYRYWMENGFFRSVPDSREHYTIVIPPPNVTGVLHMGHMLNNTIQDVLVRRARMLGKNACWVPGTDHASIATEAKVVAKLRDQGISKSDLTREEFLNAAWEWTEKHGGIILEQLKKLGASCDWERTKFTMDQELSESVIDVFIALYKKGLIYRGIRMINWDPAAKTALSDEEVIYKELQSKLYYIRYKVVNSENEWVTIATTRPETILGDTAVCVHPEDERYFHIKGKSVYVPLIKRIVPVISDEYVDREFGTGCLKITPAHDVNDYAIGIKYNLPSIDIFNEDGSMSEAAILYTGKDRFEVRKLITQQLTSEGNLVKIEDYVNKVGFSERTDAVIEPRLSIQWFLNMKEMAVPALENVLNDNVQLVPSKFKNTYRHWMENVRDWCISRQLWWGHRVPAYYIAGSKEFVIAKNAQEALSLAREKTGNLSLQLQDLKQDEDVLDTWFSSWLWPISVFDGIRFPGNEDMKYYYPTNDLITAPEILFFWVARMIMAGYEFAGAKPFQNVYLTGIVRDHLGRKMSKSLGNSPEPLELINKYGADGVRVGMLLCSPAGNDLLFDEGLPEQGRNFVNKLWNAFRLINGWEVDINLQQPEASRIAVEWFSSVLNQNIVQLDEQFARFRISEALMTVYKLIRDEFSSWYLEIVKPPFRQSIDKKSYDATIAYLDKLLHFLHPFIPFVTEEIWHLINERRKGDSLMISLLPKPGYFDQELTDKFDTAREIVANVRKIRNDRNIHAKDHVHLYIRDTSETFDHLLDPVLIKLGLLTAVSSFGDKADHSAAFIIKSWEFYIPLEHKIDKEEEIKKLLGELEYTRGFLDMVMKKLSNDRFIQSAPEKVLLLEQAKKADAEAKIKVLLGNIENLRK
ncbi:MAG: valine--tRNA ligase [Bacteroidia bacterium]|nr:valine--tRNA ligase [Bacteroidia bacterium]